MRSICWLKMLRFVPKSFEHKSSHLWFIKVFRWNSVFLSFLHHYPVYQYKDIKKDLLCDFCLHVFPNTGWADLTPSQLPSSFNHASFCPDWIFIGLFILNHRQPLVCPIIFKPSVLHTHGHACTVKCTAEPLSLSIPGEVSMGESVGHPVNEWKCPSVFLTGLSSNLSVSSWC